MPQVASDFYDSGSYDELHRWISYWYQIQAVVRAEPANVLEIGCGTRVMSDYLRNQVNIDVTTFDFDASRAPDVVGDVRSLSEHFSSASFDCVCAFQVLEHIPYEDFEGTLKQLAEVTRKSVIISLPHWGYFFQFRIHLFKQLEVVFGRKVTRPFTWQFNGQHYWEIGTRRYPLKRVLRSISKVLGIDRHYFCPDYPYHYFFECQRREPMR
jgi:SAM-dependent methyltransferase